MPGRKWHWRKSIPSEGVTILITDNAITVTNSQVMYDNGASITDVQDNDSADNTQPGWRHNDNNDDSTEENYNSNSTNDVGYSDVYGSE